MMDEKYLRPNMGTCIDCHDKVNKGEKPWVDPAYTVPPNPEETAKAAGEAVNTEKVSASEINLTATTTQTAEAAKAAHDKKTQEIILQAIGKQQKDVRISMACETCHKKVKVPSTHKIADWNQNHGGTAIQELNQCVNCHQDAKWAKEVPKEDIMTLLKTGTEHAKYTPNITVVKEQARTNEFCSTCHANRPPGHAESNQWLTGHSAKASTNEAKAECYVCHDNAKPLPGTNEPKAPTDVYCQYCHRTGFKDDVKK